jgi:hypothetical protein
MSDVFFALAVVGGFVAFGGVFAIHEHAYGARVFATASPTSASSWACGPPTARLWPSAAC